MKAIFSSLSFYRLLVISSAAVFFGRAWQHIFWDAPFRAVFWDEGLMSGLLNRLFGIEWAEFLRNPIYDERISFIIKGFGLIYFLGFLVSIFSQKKRVLNHLLIFGSLCLCFLAFLYCKEKFYTPAQFLEYSLQYASPLFLFFYLHKKFEGSLILFMKIAIALTFTSHGLYAIGYYPVPGNFMEMTMNILPLSESASNKFLITAGILDVIISILLFIPGKASRYALIYAVCWGALTCFARIAGNFELENLIGSLNQFAFESIYRIPHFIIPLAVLMSKDFRNV